MFPNGYNMPFYSMSPPPSMAMNMGIPTRMPGGLFSRLLGGSNGVRAGLGTTRAFSWQGLLNTTSKTLNVINQALPIVKQVGPVYNNMKSMLRVASLFKDETDPIPTINKNDNIKTNNGNNINNAKEKENTIINEDYSNSPRFFI